MHYHTSINPYTLHQIPCSRYTLFVVVCVPFDYHHPFIYIQVQDYYVYMRLQNRQNCMASLYRLFCVCFMLRNVSIPGAGTPHDYPKRQLSYMLLLTHWKNASHVTWQLLDGHINLFNEEYGEAVFSILSRSVLGDNIKSDFDQ